MNQRTRKAVLPECPLANRKSGYTFCHNSDSLSNKCGHDAGMWLSRKPGSPGIFGMSDADVGSGDPEQTVACNLDIGSAGSLWNPFQSDKVEQNGIVDTLRLMVQSS